MGQQQSKDELLYQQVNYGNVDGIKALRSQGAGLEWIDSEGKTPLISACMNPQLYNVAKTLIELGANINAYRPGRHAGTPLHHAAKRGLDETVKLLLSHGANALIMNDDCQTPLDVARAKGYSNVVRTIEAHLCLFSGWLREIYGPGFLGLLAPNMLSRKVYVVILPCGSRNPRKPLKLELAIYSGALDAQPRTIVQLWKSNLEEPNFNQPDPAAVISDISKSTRIKLAPVLESEKHELQRFCNACKGIPQVMHSMHAFNNQIPTAPAIEQTVSEDEQLQMAINASLQSSSIRTQPQHEGATYTGSSIDTTASGGASTSSIPSETNVSIPEPSKQSQSQDTITSITEPNLANPSQHVAEPSAPSIEENYGPIHYPSIDLSPVGLPSSNAEATSSRVEPMKEDSSKDASLCPICLDASVEGACVPCGHMAGCMSCLNEIMGKKWGCPVCRTKIDQVIRIYAV